MDSTEPVCMLGRCLSRLDACREAGGRIVFLSTRGGGLDIYGAYANGTAPIFLATGIVADGNVAPSPNGAVVAFVRQFAGGNRIATVGAFGENLQNIAAAPGQASYVEWSPDGTRLVLGDQSTLQTASAMAYVVKRDSEEHQLLGYADVAARNSDPTWSPDSSKVAFVSQSPSNLSLVGIWTANSDGGNGSVLEDVPFIVITINFRAPRWAPNGSAIAYLSTELGNLDIVLKVLNGTAGHLIQTSDSESDIAWSHDSSRIAFVRSSGASRTIWVMNADGSAPLSLTAGQHPRWSPDDRYLLFDTSRDGNREIYRMNSDGTNPTNLTNNPASDFQAEWAACPI